MGFRNPITALVDDYARTLAEQAAAKADQALTDAGRAVTAAADAYAAAEAAEATSAAVAGDAAAAQTAADTAAADAAAALQRAQDAGTNAGAAQTAADDARAAADAANSAAGTAGTAAADADAKAANAAAAAAQAIADAAKAYRETDTGPTVTGPGVRMYQTTQGTFPRGVFEMRSGAAGELATLDLVAELVDQGGAYTSTGSTTTLKGADSNGVVGPSLKLRVAPNPAGGYLSYAELDAPAVRIGRLEPLSGSRAVILPNASYAPGWSRWDTGGLTNLTFTRLPTGMIAVEGLCRWTPTATGATATITTVSGAFVPQGGHVMLDGHFSGDGVAYNVLIRRDSGLVAVHSPLPLPAAGWFRISGTYRGSEF